MKTSLEKALQDLSSASDELKTKDTSLQFYLLSVDIQTKKAEEMEKRLKVVGGQLKEVVGGEHEALVDELMKGAGEGDVAKLKQALSGVAAQASGQQAKISELEEQLNTLGESHKKKINEMSKKQGGPIEAQLSKALTQSKKDTEKIEKLNKESEASSKEAEEFKAQLAKLQKQREMDKDAKYNLEKELQILRKETKEGKDQIETLTKNADKGQELLARLNTDIEALRDEKKAVETFIKEHGFTDLEQLRHYMLSQQNTLRHHHHQSYQVRQQQLQLGQQAQALVQSQQQLALLTHKCSQQAERLAATSSGSSYQSDLVPLAHQVKQALTEGGVGGADAMATLASMREDLKTCKLQLNQKDQALREAAIKEQNLEKERDSLKGDLDNMKKKLAALGDDKEGRIGAKQNEIERLREFQTEDLRDLQVAGYKSTRELLQKLRSNVDRRKESEVSGPHASHRIHILLLLGPFYCDDD